MKNLDVSTDANVFRFVSLAIVSKHEKKSFVRDLSLFEEDFICGL